MSQRDELNLYIRRVQQRLRLDAGLRGAAVVACVALVATIVLTLILNAYAFPEGGLAPARLALLAVLIAAICFGVAWPLWRLTWRRSVGQAEAKFPEFQQRLVTFSEKEAAEASGVDEAPQSGLFLELLAADTLKVAESDAARPEDLAPRNRLLALLGAAVVCAGVLVWMIAARPGFMGYGASLLWTGPHKDVPPIYEIRVTPGDAAVRRNSDEMVTAQVVGLETTKVNLFAKYASASKWEPVAMQPQMDGSGYQFLFAGLPENVEYYVEAGPATSKHFKFRVVDLPSVKGMQVTYHYPKWTGMQMVSEEHAGDLRALEGTDAELTVTMTAPLRDGMLALDGGGPVKLAAVPGAANVYRGSIHMDKDGAYHVAAVDEGQPVRLSEDYFISTEKANPPSIAIDRPAGDYRASPIEEVTVGVKAGADFGLTHVSLHYSVNGGPDQEVSLLKQPGAKDASGSSTLSLEDFKVQPGDVVSLYATAKDNHAEAKTDISFIQVDPFEREFSQSQSGGGGGGGGGNRAQNQTDISKREKELIAATWKQVNAKGVTPEAAAATGKLLSEAQMTLKDQALALSTRMQSRDLASANEEFNSFDKDMETAAAGMQPTAEKLKALQWQAAMPLEQKVLQALLRAEATFRQIEVAFGQRGGGGGGGGGGAGRDLASLFDLEMDTQKNQYETAQTGSPAEEQAKKVDDALAKLDALAKRQEELAQQQGNQQQTFQQRWQQEMLRREAEQLQKQMEQMQGQQGQQGADGQQSGQQGQQSGPQSGQQGQSGQAGQQGQSGRSGQAGQSQTASRGNPDGSADPRVTQALERLRAANEAMGRAGAQQGAQQSADAAKSAAQRLQEATDLLGGAQKQQASSKLDQLGQQADRLTKEENAEAERVRKLAAEGEAIQKRAEGGAGGAPTQAEMQAAEKERGSLADARQQMSDGLSDLEKGMRDSARELAGTQPGASGKLRDALSGMDQNDLTNLVQRTADWLRQGFNPNSNGTETTIASGLKKLDDQVHQAQQAAGSGANGRGPQDLGAETAALDHVDRLRSAIEGLGPSGRQGLQRGQSGQGQQAGQQQGRGQQGQGQQGQGQLTRGQQGQQGQQGQGQGQQGQGQQGQGQGQLARGGQGNQQGQGGRGGANAQQGGSARNGRQGGEIVAGRVQQNGGGGQGAAIDNVDTGGQTYGSTRSAAAPQVGLNPADTQRTIEQGTNELNQLRQIAKNDPAALKQIEELGKEMEKLDPSRFPGNPAMVEELHTRVLHDVDKLELQLRRSPDDAQLGQVRTKAAAKVPPGYEDAVAEYYRRLGKGQ
jgi:hypothetical protein